MYGSINSFLVHCQIMNFRAQGLGLMSLLSFIVIFFQQTKFLCIQATIHSLYVNQDSYLQMLWFLKRVITIQLSLYVLLILTLQYGTLNTYINFYILGFIWMPQLLCNIFQDLSQLPLVKPPLSLGYALSYTANVLLVPVYFKMYSGNFLELEPDFEFRQMLIALFAA